MNPSCIERTFSFSYLNVLSYTRVSLLCLMIAVYILAVQTAKTICSESKNKNMMRSDIDAPIGKNMA